MHGAHPTADGPQSLSEIDALMAEARQLRRRLERAAAEAEGVAVRLDAVTDRLADSNDARPAAKVEQAMPETREPRQRFWRRQPAIGRRSPSRS